MEGRRGDGQSLSHRPAPRATSARAGTMTQSMAEKEATAREWLRTINALDALDSAMDEEPENSKGTGKDSGLDSHPVAKNALDDVSDDEAGGMLRTSTRTQNGARAGSRFI